MGRSGPSKAMGLEMSCGDEGMGRWVVGDAPTSRLTGRVHGSREIFD